MNLEKFTERSRGFIQAAQTIAMRESHQRVLPDHLLKALMDDDQGLASNLIRKAGGSSERVNEAINTSIAKLPKVTGGDGNTYVDPSLVRVLDEAEAVAKKAGDSFVPVERLLTALALVNTRARDALTAGAVNAQALNAAINEVRKGRTADSASSEETMEALNKYARDLTEAAASGKIDPIIGRDEEIRRTMQVLSRRTKNNPVLIGEPGVGKTAIAEGLALQVASLPDKEDPDSFVRKHGRAELDALISKARPAWEFLAAQAIAETRALDSVQGARLAVEKLAPILHELPSPEERTLFERQLAETLRMDDKLVADIARSAQRRAPAREGEAAVVRPVEAPIPLSDLKLLEMLVLVPGARALYAGRDIESLVSDARTRDVAERLVDVEGGVSEALEVIPQGTARDQLMRRLAEAPQMADGLGAFEKLVMVLRRESVERKLESIRRDERQAWLSRDEEMALSLSLQKMKLERQRDDLLKAIRD
jgi:ATP-dependent Clp protease ATP-binding subunit ClpB